MSKMYDIIKMLQHVKTLTAEEMTMLQNEVDRLEAAPLRSNTHFHTHATSLHTNHDTSTLTSPEDEA